MSTYDNAGFKLLSKKRKDTKAKSIYIQQDAAKSTKPVKQKSRTQNIIDILRKNENKFTNDNPNSIASFLLTQSYKINESDAKFYSKIILLTYNNYKVNINDILGGRTFNITLISPEVFTEKSCVFSNDKLYWLSVIHNLLKDNNLRNCLIDNDISLSIQSYSIVIDKSYEKGFIQDYNKYFSFLGLSTLGNVSGINYSELYKGLSSYEEFAKRYPNYIDKYKLSDRDYFKQTFSYNGIKFNSYRLTSGLFLCVKDGINEGDVVNAMKNTLLIESKSNNKNGLKVIEVSKNYEGMNVFISQKMKLSDFVPGVVIFPKLMRYRYLIKVSLDMPLLDEYLYKEFTKGIIEKKTMGSYFNIDNLVDWNSIDLFVNYVIVLLSTRLKEGDEFEVIREQMKNFLKEYEDMKIDINEFKKFYSDITSFLYKFYDSFHNKINIDVCDNLLKIAAKYKTRIIFYDQNGELVRKMAKIFFDYSLISTCKICYISLTKISEILEVYKLVEKALTTVRNGESDNLESQLREAGIAVFQLQEKSITNEIRTPSAFLGNLGGIKDAPIIKAVPAKAIFEYDVSLKKDREKAKSEIEIAKLMEEINSRDAILYSLSDIADGLDLFDDKLNREGKINGLFINYYDENPIKSEDILKDLVSAGKIGIVKNDNKAIVEVYNKNKEFLNTYLNNFAENLKMKAKLKGLKELDKKIKIGDITLKILGDPIGKLESKFKMEDVTYTVSKAPKRKNVPNPSTKYLGIDEQVNDDKLKALGIENYETLRGITLNKKQKETLNAWRIRGVTDDILYEFWKDLENNDKIVVPAISTNIGYLSSLQNITQERYGDLKKDLGPKIPPGPGSSSTMAVEA